MNSRLRHRSLWVWGLGAMLLALVPVTASAQSTEGDGQRRAPPEAHIFTGQNVEAFADAFFEEKMADQHVPGMTFVVVKDGAILVAKGYGYANLEQKTPVTADTTIFHTASVAKVFTASAVMQLVEQGKLKLDVDVNTYLKEFQVPDTFAQPITLAHLLTHTAGFDELIVGYSPRSEAERTPLHQFIRERMPPRVRPPGELYSYSNYGFALLGHIVEVVSGVPYAQYMDDQVLRPLSMERSGFKVRPELAPIVATGYAYSNGSHRALAFPYVNSTPASELTATATDMAHFMIAHLQGGSYEAARVLQEATVQEMHRQHFTHHPLLQGMAYGFHEYPGHQLPGLGHGGAVDGFSSLLYLLPEEHLGFFLANNLDGAEDLQTAFTEAFLDHFYPSPSPHHAAPAPAALENRNAQLAGSYRRVRQSQATLDKLGSLFGLFGGDVQVAANPDGTLRIRGADWTPIAPLAFRSVSDKDIIAFREDHNGAITHLLAGQNAFFRVPWYDTPSVGLLVAVLALAVFLLTAIGWPLQALIQRWRKGATPSAGATQTRARWLAWTLCALNLVFVVGFMVALRDPLILVHGAPPLLLVSLGLALITTLLTLPVLGLAGLGWKHGYWSAVGRVHYTVVALAAVGFVWFLNQWNLLGFRL